MISFSQAECNMDERFIASLNSEIMLGKKIDTIVYKSETDVFVKRQQKDFLERFILYESAVSDLKVCLERVTKTASYFVNKYEKLPRIVPGMRDIVDRFSCCLEILEWEQKYQLGKLQLLEEYMSIYENVVDPIELYRVSEYILSLVDLVPLVDSESYYFKDSYRLSIL